MSPPLLADTAAAVESPLDIRHSLWHRHARCAGKTDLFFAQDGEPPSTRIEREAVAVRLCEACPVRAICRDIGRENREIGVWGGETDEQRAAAGYPPRNLARRSVIRAARAARARETG